MAISGAAGRHYYFRYPKDAVIGNSTSQLGLGLDVKSDGGLIVMAPSLHPVTGQKYMWSSAHHPNDTPIAEMPPWLVDLLIQNARIGQGPPLGAPACIPEGRRNNELYRLGRSLKAKGLTREAHEAALLAENISACDPPLPDAEVKAIITHSWDQPDHCQFARPRSHDSMDKTSPELQDDQQWPELDQAAIRGVIGDLVRTIEPESEADPAALLLQALIAYGNILNRGPYFQVEADRHYLNLNAAAVGDTAKGRKGTSWGHIRKVYARIDPDWACNRILTGLSSGEGLIWSVRDPIIKHEPIREQGKPTGECQSVIVDPGIDDKRLLVLESEFARTLAVMNREGNTLSPVIRQAWDSGDLRTMTKNSSAQATGAHISMIAHITKDELCRLIGTIEASNGFCNRWLWLCVRRSKILPEGGHVSEEAIGRIADRLSAAVRFGRSVGEIRRDDAARALWREIYPALSEGKPGLLGSVISRAEAQVMRLSCLYALQDLSPRYETAFRGTVKQTTYTAVSASWPSRD
jgi:hypothetical protein